MPSLKDLKGRIKSVKSTQKITKAMKMVAAAKLRRAREAAEAAQPYAAAMERMVQRMATGVAGRANLPVLLGGTGSDYKHLLIVTTGDRGLSGAFNSSIVRAAKKRVRELQVQNKQVFIYAIGRKARDMMGEYKSLIVGSRIDVTKNAKFDVAEQIAREIFDVIETQHIDVATLLFNQFKSVISQVVTFQQLMPLEVAAGGTNESTAASYEFEPEEEEILADLLPRNFQVQIFKALLESTAGFYGAQMNSMENATKNAGEMIKKLSLKYNRTRQANITKELIEIISGAEAI